MRQDTALNRQQSMLCFVQPPSVVDDDNNDDDDCNENDDDYCDDKQEQMNNCNDTIKRMTKLCLLVQHWLPRNQDNKDKSETKDNESDKSVRICWMKLGACWKVQWSKMPLRTPCPHWKRYSFKMSFLIQNRVTERWTAAKITITTTRTIIQEATTTTRGTGRQ